MSAFDTSTNTRSVSFSDAYNCAVLAPSAEVQHVYGFGRTEDKRYFECFINDQGGDPSRLWVGVENSPLPGGARSYAFLLGGLGIANNWNGVVLPDNPSEFSGLTTISTNDVYMFSVDFGGGTDHAGVQRVSTITAAGSVLYLPVCISWGKNGTWADGYNVGFYIQPGYPNYQRPAVFRGSTSASDASVSLRVVTTSFAYTIPTGYVAWGDGPEGGTSVTADAAVTWDPTKVSANMSLSGSNLYAVSELSTTYQFVLSTVLPTTGKRVVEFHMPTAANWGVGLADVGVSITSTAYQSVDKIGWPAVGNTFYKRSVNSSSSLSSTDFGYNFYGNEPGRQFFIDFDTARFWATGGLQTGAGTFAGDKGAAVADPYEGAAGLTCTASVGGHRLYGEYRSFQLQGIHNYLNVGQEPFATYPLLPGWVSMNGNRQVYGVGATWHTNVAPVSSSFESSNLTVRTNAQCVTQGTTTKSSGKYYFEIFSQRNQGDPRLYSAFGIRQASATTISATTIGLAIDSGLYFDFVNTAKCRYGITSSWTVASLIPPSSGMCQGWVGIAVDFDQGYVWCGLWNKVTRTMGWLNDPATLANPDMTFTANTEMRIACTSPTNSLPIILVAEDNNVIGLPTGFQTWNGGGPESSITATPSGTVPPGGSRVLWPYGVQT